MGPVESKSNITIEVEVKSRTGIKKGHLSLTSGNLYYYRPSAKSEAARYTYQQLIELIENDLE